MEDLLVLRDWSSIDEVPELLDVWRNSVEGGRDLLSAADIDAVAAALEAVYTLQVRVRIAEIGDRIVGFSAFSPERIQLLWVVHHDRHQGIGSRLLKDMLELAPGLCVQINGQSRETLEFFTDHGFEKDPAKDPGRDPVRIDLRHVPSGARDVAR
ncbi:GNAT family N-acetyltransferase [Glutamicibacter sp.]|uniref:GNAT family N-acetyltransferase n=1 Tax=Glutamicibacter sp. TaxID=1931995 RepID=UPI0028BD7C78|nr:GNAT family N-acetyltransferase [Glutamicibacter sp.]